MYLEIELDPMHSTLLQPHWYHVPSCQILMLRSSSTGLYRRSGINGGTSPIMLLVPLRNRVEPKVVGHHFLFAFDFQWTVYYFVCVLVACWVSFHTTLFLAVINSVLKISLQHIVHYLTCQHHVPCDHILVVASLSWLESVGLSSNVQMLDPLLLLVATHSVNGGDVEVCQSTVIRQ